MLIYSKILFTKPNIKDIYFFIKFFNKNTAFMWFSCTFIALNLINYIDIKKIKKYKWKIP